MKPILDLFWQICLLRRSPAQVPGHGWFLALVVVTNLLCSFGASGLQSGFAQPLPLLTALVVSQAAKALLVLGALASKDLSARFTTTLTALFGCDLIITACAGVLLPLSTLLGGLAPTLVVLSVLVWTIAVAGFILQRALDTSLPLGIGAALLIEIISVSFGQLAIDG